MAETKTINLDVETNLGSLRTQLRQAQAEVAAMAEKFGATSVEAANAAKKAAELKDKIADAKALTDAFNPDAKFNALSTSIGGVLNGFQAFEGALGVMGVESEDLQKTLLKVQSAMALSQGLQGVFEAKDSFIQLGSVVKNSFAAMTAAGRAFALTGIGLVVTAIGGLIYAYQTMNDEAEKAAKAQKTLDNNIKETTKSIENQKENIDTLNVIRDLETRRIIAEAKKRGASEEELTRISIQAKKDRINTLKDEVELAKKLYLQKSKYGTTEEYEASRKNFLEIQKTYDELQVSLEENLADEIVKKREKITKQQQINNQKTQEELIKQREEKQKLLNEIDDLSTKSLDAPKEARDRDLESANSYYNELSKMSGDYLNKKATDITKEIQLENELRQKKLQMASNALSILSEATTLFNAKNEKDARAQFKIQKAFNLAAAITNTANAVTSALATINPVPGGRFIEAGIAAAAGAVNIAKISATQFNSGGGAPPSAPSPAGGTNVAAPNLSFSMQGAGGGIGQLLSGVLNQPIKAYVVSSDITNAQMLDAKAIKTSVL